MDLRVVIAFLILRFKCSTNAQCLGVLECQCERSENNIQIINCRNKQLTSVPKFVDSREHYREVILEENKIQNLQLSAFGKLIVNSINLNSNPIVYIAPNAFLGIEADLNTLILGLDQTALFPSTSLTGLINLKSLQIFNYGQSNLPIDAFNGIPQLEELVMVGGKLADLYTPSLDGLKALKSLKLDLNHFNAVPMMGLSRLQALRTFSIAGNLITSLNANSFNSSSVVEEMDLSRNSLAGNVAPDTFITFSKSLKYLTVSSCDLLDSSLAAFTPIKSLITLNLQGNGITNIPDNFLQNLSNLLHLNLAQNQITRLSENIFKNSEVSLMNLNLANNPLSITISNTFISLTSMETLIFRNLKSVRLDPQTLQPMQKTLKVLDLSGTPTDETIFASLLPLKLLQELNISASNLQSLPPLAFKNNSNLRILDVSNNKLSSLPEQVFQGLERSLTQINLDNNKITTLEMCTFDNLQNFDPLKLSITGNPIDCNCNLKWLYNKIKTKSELYLSTLTWRCQSGESFSSMNNTFEKCPAVENECSTLHQNDSHFEALALEIKQITENSALMHWSVDGAMVIYGFIISYETLDNATKFSKSSELHSSLREFLLSDLSASTEYRFCVTMLASSDWKHETKSCQVGQTLSSSHNNLLGPILGGVLGGLALIAIICIIVCFVLGRKKIILKKKETFVNSQPTTSCFSRESMISTSNPPSYSSKEIPPSPNYPMTNNLTTQEQDNILSFMLASTASKRTNSLAAENWSQNSIPDLSVSTIVEGENVNAKRKRHPKSNASKISVNNSMEDNVFESTRAPAETTV